MVDNPKDKPGELPAPGRRIGIRAKIVVPFVLLFLACLIPVGTIAVNQVTDSVEKRLNPERLASLIIRAGFPLNEASLNRIKEIVDCEIITLSEEYEILHSTLPEQAKKKAAIYFSTIARERQIQPSVMINDSDFSHYYYVFHPVKKTPAEISQVAGLVLAIPKNIVDREKRQTIRPILVAGVIGTVLIIIIGLYIAHTITRPLRKLTKFASDLTGSTEKDIQKRVTVASTDETLDLANAFNSMLTRLSESEGLLVEREKMAAIGSIATGMAHEIRNPLSSIRMTVELLLRKIEDESTKYELELILSEIERLSFTLSELLIFARPPLPAKEKCNAKTLVNETLAFMRSQLEHHEIKVDLDTEENLPEVPLDPNHFKQVLLNLVINSLEAMPGGGKISISMKTESDNLLLVLKDSGGGIPEGLEDTVFEAFFTTKSGGSGLGLAVTKIIITSHGGNIGYTSSMQGTEFRITFPLGEIKTENPK